MKICGLQKLTLLDYPGRVACTVFLGECNFRCPWCHNYELAAGEWPVVLDQDELMKFLKSRVGQLDGVVISGGEPCLNPDLIDLLKEIKALRYHIKLDTNGTRPEMLHRLIERNMLDYIAMDIKAGPLKYPSVTGLGTCDLASIRKSINIIMTSGVGYEFRTTVIRELHDESDFFAIATMIEGARRYFLQPFRDSAYVPYNGFHAPDDETMKHYAHIVAGSVEEVRIRSS